MRNLDLIFFLINLPIKKTIKSNVAAIILLLKNNFLSGSANIDELDDTVVQFERTGFVRLEGDKAFFLHR